MKLRELTKEDIVRCTVRLLRSGIQFNYASDYADMIESGRWLDDDIWDNVEHNEGLR